MGYYTTNPVEDRGVGNQKSRGEIFSDDTSLKAPSRLHESLVSQGFHAVGNATCTLGVRLYGYRYYSPELGRWSSRDPIGEIGSIPFRVRYNASKRKVARLNAVDGFLQFLSRPHVVWLEVLEAKLRLDLILRLIENPSLGINEYPTELYLAFANSPLDKYDVLGLYPCPGGGRSYPGADRPCAPWYHPSCIAHAICRVFPCGHGCRIPECRSGADGGHGGIRG